MLDILFLREPSDKLKKYFDSNLDLNKISLHYNSENIDMSIIDCVIGWRPNLEQLKQMPNLRLFINPGTGVQHLMGDISNYFVNNHIILCNGHGNSYFTAQHAVAMFHSLSNQLIHHHNWFVDGLWRRGDDFAKSDPIRDKIIGLLGYGAINHKIHRFLSGYDVKFALLKNKWSKDKISELKSIYNNIINFYDISELNLFLSKIDVLIIAIPLTKASKNLITISELELLGSKGILINVGRGEIINEESLYNALKNNTIKAAAIDVWYNYQPKAIDDKKYPYDVSHPFHTLENILLSPHRAASPFDDINRWNEVIINLKKLVDNQFDFINIVDLIKGY